MAKPVPAGYHAVTPSLTLKDSQKAIDFYQKAFGYSWMIATHTQDLTPEQICKGAEAFFAQMAKK